jgi:WD40 repeat protein
LLRADAARAPVPWDVVQVSDLNGGPGFASHPAGVAERGDASAIAWSPDGRTIAYGWYMDPDVRRLWLWEPTTGKFRELGTADPVGTLVFSPDGKQLAAGCGHGTLRVWKVQP